MGLRNEDEIGRADLILGRRIRDVFLWYARGFLTECEALQLIGRVCLAWAGEMPAGNGRRKPRPPRKRARDAV